MVLQKQTLQLPHLRRMSLNYFVLRNTKRKLFLRDIYIFIYIYFLTDREVLSANSENRKQYLTLVAEHVWGLLAPKLYTGKHCKAKQTKKKETHDFDCTKYIKYYSPKAQLHALYHKQHKKVSSFAFELCTCLPRNRVTYVCMCACVVLRLLSTGWKASPVDAFGEGQDDAVLRPTNDERALLTPSELHQTFSFTGGQASLLLLPLCPGDLRLDPGQKKQPSHTIWPVTHLF